MAELLAASDGLIYVEYGAFRLIDDADPQSEYSGSWSQSGLPSDLVTMDPEDGLATFLSADEDNEPYVRLEYWSAQPEEPEGVWEGTFRGGIEVPGGRLIFVSYVSSFDSPHELSLPPGSYHLGVWCRGRAALMAGADDAIAAGTRQRGVERWLVRLWPVDHTD
jgi:hypothetical protein